MQDPFEIGGVTVPAGTRTAIQLPITDLSTHVPIAMPVMVLHGRQKGPCLFVCAALHGDEINGIEITRRLLQLKGLKSLRGTLIAIPVVNVMGILSLSRYLPDRRDLNRSFPGSARGSLASRLARLFLDEIVARATHGVDLHTGAIHRDNYPQIRGNLDDPETEKLASAFGVPVVINAGFREGSLREAAASVGVPVVVYEAGEALRFHEPSIRAGVKGVLNIMRTLGMLSPLHQGEKKRAPLIIRSSKWVRAPRSGLLRSTTPLGQQVNKGDLLAAIADPFGDNEVDVVATSDGIVIGKTNLPLVHEGDGLFHLAHHAGKQVVARSLDEFDPEIGYESGMTSELSEEPRIV